MTQYTTEIQKGRIGDQTKTKRLCSLLASYGKGGGAMEGGMGSLPGWQWFQLQASSTLCPDQATGQAVQMK